MGVKRLLAVSVSCLAAVILLAVAGWMLLGRDGGGSADGAVQIIPPADATISPDPNTVLDNAPASQTADAPGPTEIAVYITGEVVNPGVYTATSGQRLDDVLALAGGPTENADLSRVNLAAYVTDAAHYKIPAVSASGGDAAAGADAGAPSDGAAASADACVPPIDINKATADCLETLPGIGSVRAHSIVEHRERMGPFATTEGITEVSGIGDGIYRRIADLIVVDAR